MRNEKLPALTFLSTLFAVAVAVAVVLLITSTRAIAQTETVLHSFADNGTDGYQTYAGLIFDASGNLYGTTLEGGTHANCYEENIGCGTVFELSPKSGGGWTETIVHDFDFNGTDGVNPSGSLSLDSAGNLYGVTLYGGNGVCGSSSEAGGTVFELSPKSGGGWTEKILYNFGANGTDGCFPQGGLVFDAAGNLYGTTAGGGANGFGTVFELTPIAGGSWLENVLFSFDGVSSGSDPLASLIFDAKGNLYGTAWSGGSDHQGGVVFELSPSAGGTWTEKTLHSFSAAGGENPHSGLTFDKTGNLYGTAQIGGTFGDGTVYRLTPDGNGNWTENVLHNFDHNGTDGYQPLGGLVFDAKGNLWGTTFNGGDGACKRSGCGTAFELSPASSGGWTETVYSFPSYAHGYWPASNLTFDSTGTHLYGTTVNGGSDGGCVCGTVFEFTP